MADKEMTKCQVCCQHFTETGEQVPRILPCFHTLCEVCVANGIGKDNKLKCPECSRVHPAPNGAKSFTQNKYILIHLRQMLNNTTSRRRSSRKRTLLHSNTENEGKENKRPKIQEDEEIAEMCEQHDKKMILFCRQRKCQKLICDECLTSEHKKHDFVSLKERLEQLEKDTRMKHEALVMNLNADVDDLEIVKKNLLEGHKKAKKKSSDTVMRLRLRKELVLKEITKKFVKMSKEAKEKHGSPTRES